MLTHKLTIPSTFPSPLRYPAKTLKKESLQKFYQDKSLPLVGEKTYTSSGRYRNTKLPIVYVFAELDLKKNWKGAIPAIPISNHNPYPNPACLS